MKVSELAYVAVAAFGLGLAARADVIYVAPDGTGDGSDADHPASLGSAVENAPAGSVVQLADGEYVVNSWLTVKNAITIRGNAVDRERVVITNTNEAATPDGGFFKANNATQFLNLTMTGAKLDYGDSNNTAGSGACIQGSTSTIASNCLFRANLNKSCRSICYQVTVFDSTFLNNTAKYGVCTQRGKLYRCRLIGNHATGNGAIANDPGEIADCLIEGNKTSGDQGLVWGSGNFYNCTIVKNVMPTLGSLTLNSCIAWGNTNSSGAAIGSKLNCTRSYVDSLDLTNVVDGTVISTDDPGFVDFAGGDYHLKAVSDCIDRGYAVVGQNRSLDLDGHVRTFGPKPDLGCYERTGYKLGDLGLSVASCTFNGKQATVTLSLQAGDAAYDWTFDWGDGTVMRDTATVATGGLGMTLSLVHDYEVCNDYSVTFSARLVDDGRELVHTVTENITVHFPENSVYHIDAVNGDDLNDGSEAHPYQSINKLLLATEGCTVRLAPGRYQTDEEMVVRYANVKIVGDTAHPDRVVIFRPADATRRYRLLRLEKSGFELSGVTFENGDADANGGGGVYQAGPGCVDNCIFKDCTASGGGGLYSNNSATIYSTVFTNCLAHKSEGGGVFTYNVGVISNCVFHSNKVTGSARGAAFATTSKISVFDSVFFRNLSQGGNEWSSVFRRSCDFRRCLFVENGEPDKIFANDSTSQFEDCLFLRNNIRDSNGGLGDTSAFVNCSFLDNTVVLNGAVKTQMRNCLWLNNKTTAGEIVTGFTTAIFTCAFASDEYADAAATGIADESGCLFLTRPALGVKMADVALDDWDWSLATPYYTLKAASPLAAGGDLAFVDTTARPFDLAQNPRVYTKGANIGSVAIGCYQAADSTPLRIIVR